jgi:hypothetical protein
MSDAQKGPNKSLTYKQISFPEIWTVCVRAHGTSTSEHTTFFKHVAICFKDTVSHSI